jgi:rubrerythrin
MFSAKEIIDLAIQIEENAEKVYREASEKTSDPEISAGLQWLAEEELRHTRWFSELREELESTANDPELEEMGTAILRGVLGEEIFSLKDVDLSQTDHIKDLFRMVIQFEKDTVLFFEMIRSLAEDEETLKHLNQIIQEENRHVQVLEEFVSGSGSLNLVTLQGLSA